MKPVISSLKGVALASTLALASLAAWSAPQTKTAAAPAAPVSQKQPTETIPVDKASALVVALLPETEVAQLTQGCKADRAQDCFKLAHNTVSASGDPKRFARALELFHKACHLGSGPACTRAGVLESSGYAGPIDMLDAVSHLVSGCRKADQEACLILARRIENPAERAVELAKACVNGSAGGCLDLVQQYGQGIGVEKSPEQRAKHLSMAQPLLKNRCSINDIQACENDERLARELGTAVPDHAAIYRAACEANNGAACRKLSEVRDTDLAQRRELLAKGCEQGDGLSCQMAADIAPEAGGDVGQDRTAEAWLRRACEHGRSEACARLSHLAANGVNMVRDFAKAADFARKAFEISATSADRRQKINAQDLVSFEERCNAKDSYGCYRMAESLAKGKLGLAVSETVALSYWTRACDLGEPAACKAAGKALRSGAGTASNSREAIEVFRKGCSLGLIDSCVEGAVTFRDAAEISDRHFRAREMLESACKASNARGCLLLGEAYEKGLGTRRSLTTAMEHYGRACDLESDEGCAAYSRLNRK